MVAAVVPTLNIGRISGKVWLALDTSTSKKMFVPSLTALNTRARYPLAIVDKLLCKRLKFSLVFCKYVWDWRFYFCEFECSESGRRIFQGNAGMLDGSFVNPCVSRFRSLRPETKLHFLETPTIRFQFAIVVYVNSRI